MGLNLEYLEGQTPLDEEEKDGLLIKTIATREELDELEQQNIELGIEWTLKRKFSREKVLTEEFVKKLHYEMFGRVWKWAGKFRQTNKNLGEEWQKIPLLLRQLNDDCSFWIANKTFTEEEIAIRYKHRIVQIHCFANGNGRHSRLMGDVLISHLFDKPVFSWGNKSLNKKNTHRFDYLKALKEADKGMLQALIDFSRS